MMTHAQRARFKAEVKRLCCQFNQAFQDHLVSVLSAMKRDGVSAAQRRIFRDASIARYLECEGEFARMLERNILTNDRDDDSSVRVSSEFLAEFKQIKDALSS